MRVADLTSENTETDIRDSHDVTLHMRDKDGKYGDTVDITTELLQEVVISVIENVGREPMTKLRRMILHENL